MFNVASTIFWKQENSQFCLGFSHTQLCGKTTYFLVSLLEIWWQTKKCGSFLSYTVSGDILVILEWRFSLVHKIKEWCFTYFIPNYFKYDNDQLSNLVNIVINAVVIEMIPDYSTLHGRSPIHILREENYEASRVKH